MYTWTVVKLTAAEWHLIVRYRYRYAFCSLQIWMDFNENCMIQFSLLSIHIWKSYSKKQRAPDFMEHGVANNYCIMPATTIVCDPLSVGTSLSSGQGQDWQTVHSLWQGLLPGTPCLLRFGLPHLGLCFAST